MQTLPDYAAIDAYIQKQMHAWHIPGAAVIIVQADQVAHLQAFGQADAKNPVTAQTLFEVASCTKSFTALAILQLAEQGKLDLNTPVQQYIPWFRVADAEASKPITLRHLLNQSSGISGLNSNKATMPERGLTLEEQVRAIQNQPLTTQPGAVYQ
jgi:CubicO group peptidase (beta-lactamase class C family)